METRLHLNTQKFMVEFPDTEEGLKKIKEFRKINPDFKGKKIRKVIQAYPSLIVCGRIYACGKNFKPYCRDVK